MNKDPARLAALLDAAGAPGSTTWFRAPGRVNLMGDHTDYNEGFVLPLAIDRECLAAVRPREDGRVVVSSVQYPGQTAEVDAGGGDDPARVEPAWARLVAGVVRALAERGRPPAGAAIALSSDVPAGSGLASSAAVEVATALALAHAAHWTIEPAGLAAACRDGEEGALGVPCGIMDQTVCVAARPGAALLLDCRSLRQEHFPVPSGITILAVHSGMPRTLELSAYAERRAACERAARRLGVPALRDVDATAILHDPIARHVVSENVRVPETARALRAGDRRRLGELFAASHASLRDDFRVSTPELDALVGALTDAGAVGARLTGAGFGGCIVGLIDDADMSGVLSEAMPRYTASTGLAAVPLPCRAAGGAGRVYV